MDYSYKGLFQRACLPVLLRTPVGEALSEQLNVLETLFSAALAAPELKSTAGRFVQRLSALMGLKGPSFETVARLCAFLELQGEEFMRSPEIMVDLIFGKTTSVYRALKERVDQDRYPLLTLTEVFKRYAEATIDLTTAVDLALPQIYLFVLLLEASTTMNESPDVGDLSNLLIEHVSRPKSGRFERSLTEYFDPIEKSIKSRQESSSLLTHCTSLQSILISQHHICVIGTTKAGKSSLLNSLWGFETSPGCGHTTTAVPYYFTGVENICVIDLPGIDDKERLSHYILKIASAVLIVAHTNVISRPVFRILEDLATIQTVPTLLILNHVDSIVTDALNGRPKDTYTVNELAGLVLNEAARTVRGYTASSLLQHFFEREGTQSSGRILLTCLLDAEFLSQRLKDVLNTPLLRGRIGTVQHVRDWLRAHFPELS